MLTSVDFVRFRGFDRLHADLVPHAYIVGPNSAGKSTVLEAIALAEHCLRVARRKGPTSSATHNGRRWRVFPLPPSIDSLEDPVRYDFGQLETRVSVQWATGARINMVWPEEVDGEDERGYFYLEEDGGSQPGTIAAVKALFSPVTIVPVVTPLDRLEELKNPAYVETNSTTRLASRHFRNHAWLMEQAGQWDVFKSFCTQWLPEIQLVDVTLSAMANRLAVFYAEAGSRVPKELAWAGDGIQIWVQLLWHIFRAGNANTIVLDEPEVYLHPDLQRRLVRLLDGLSAQIILASHSADVIAEAPPEGVLWVDRRMGGARRTQSQSALSALSESLGSSFNLALARSMRARLVIATDCEDLRVVRVLAKNIGAITVANEHVVSVVHLREVDSWRNIGALGASLREVLPQKLPAIVLLQGGYRPKAVNDEIISRLNGPGISVRILDRPDIDNYLLDAETIARVSGAAAEVIAVRMAEAAAASRDDTRAAFITEWMASAREGEGMAILSRAERVFDELWHDGDRRMELVRGATIIKALNKWFEKDGYKAINSYRLARAAKAQIYTAEMLGLLLGIEDMLS